MLSEFVAEQHLTVNYVKISKVEQQFMSTGKKNKM
jgi:hypothetical protein